MRILRSAAAVLILLSPFTRSHAQSKTIAERLGYPADSKLLIIHADDLAVAHSEDIASFDALDKGAATSASIMIPCPWLTEVADYAKSHPDADLGLHLTLTSEWKTYRWGSVAPQGPRPQLSIRRVPLFRCSAISSQQRQGRRRRAGDSRAGRTRHAPWGFIPRTSTATWACFSAS